MRWQPLQDVLLETTKNEQETVAISVGRTGEIEDIFSCLSFYKFMGLNVVELK